MKYCVQFYRDFRHFNEVSEIILKYGTRTPGLVEAVQKYDVTQRVIVDLCLCDEEDFLASTEIFMKACEVHPNIAFRAMPDQFPQLRAYCEAWNRNFFYATHATTEEIIKAYIADGVSDIYLTDDLGFSFNKLHSKYNVNFRLFLNVAQVPNERSKEPNFNGFFIRPDDVHLYDYDNVIFEFFGPLDRQSVLYEIYSKGKWLGDLNDLILGLNLHIDNRTITPGFGQARQICQHKCGECSICDTTAHVAEMLKENGVGFTSRGHRSEMKVYDDN